MTTAIETRQLTKLFADERAVDAVSLAIPAGSIYGIVGANGAGKSTLLHLMLGLLWPSYGEVRVFDQPLTKESAEIRQRVHHVAADAPIAKSFRVADLVHYASLLYKGWDGARIRRLLDALQLSPRQHIRHLSLGQQAQLRLAVALSARPDVLLLDEPTSGLDPVVRKQFLQLLAQEAGNGVTILMATHQLEPLERIADGLAVMYRGRLIAHGVLEEMRLRIRCYQAVIPAGLPDAIRRNTAVIRTENRGSLWTVVAEDTDGRIRHELSKTATVVEPVDLNLDDLFTHLLSKEGYTRDAILLA